MGSLNALAESQLHAHHYLKHVTEMGDAHPIVATRDINSATGLKLVSKGTRFDSRLYERLLRHKLLPPLDHCLSVENPVASELLAQEARSVLETDAMLAGMRSALADENALLEFVGKASLSPIAAFKLTVMREQHPDLYRHSIFIALVSLYIGMQSGLGREILPDLAIAALLHDIGILHVDPALFERSHHMNDMERRHLYVHPLIAYLILSENRDYPASVLDAVLQHHERLDGSGYPQGLEGTGISKLAQIIAVAEIVASRVNRETQSESGLRLETILKINSRRYGASLVSHLKVFYQKEELPAGAVHEDKGAILERLRRISIVLSQWNVISECCHTNPLISEFVSERMNNLRHSLLSAGFDPDAADMFIAGAEDDPHALVEIRIFANEAIWQVGGLFQEIRRRWPELESDQSPAIMVLRVWMDEVRQLILE